MRYFLAFLFLPFTLAAQNVTNMQVGQRFSVGTNVSNVVGTGGGGNVWYDSFTGTQTTSLNGSGGSFMEFDTHVTVSAGGTIDMLRVMVDHVATGLPCNVKLAVFDNGGTLVTSGTVVLTGGESLVYVEVTGLSQVISSGTYTVCFTSDADVFLSSGAGSASNYAGSSGFLMFPPGTLPAPAGAFGQLYLGLHIQ